jgi:hypothetical protein
MLSIFLVPGASYFVVLAAIVCGLALCVWAVIDAAMTPQAAFRAAGRSKELWITLIAVLTFCTGFGGIMVAIIYLLGIRPRLSPHR